MQQNQQAPFAVAEQTKQGIENTLGATSDGNGGPKSMLDMYNGMLGNQALVNQQADATKNNVQSTLGSTTDGNGGSNSVNMMHGNMINTQGLVFNQAGFINSNVQGTLGSTTDGGGGSLILQHFLVRYLAENLDPQPSCRQLSNHHRHLSYFLKYLAHYLYS
ncbi:hypothetical protein ACT4UT_19825, partial [Bacillus sp. B-TM1]